MVHYIDKFPDRIIETKNGDYHYFGGTSYLGLQTHKEFKKLFTSNIMRYGTHYGASRASNVRFSIYDKAERFLANHIGSESCITLSSGYMASQLLSQYFTDPIYQSYRTPYSHDSFSTPGQIKVQDYNEFHNALKNQHPNQIAVVFLDSIDFMGLNYPAFEGLRSLHLENCIVVVDDSHGFGIIGEHGSGVFRDLADLPFKELIVCGSLGKGFGLQLGGVFGSKKRIVSLSQSPSFGGSSPATPATMATLIESQAIMEHQREKLKNNLKLFRSLLKKPEFFIHSGDHPTFTFLDEELTMHLSENKIIVTSFNYPTKDSALMSRIVLSAFHTQEDIEFLTAAINGYKKTS